MTFVLIDGVIANDTFSTPATPTEQPVDGILGLAWTATSGGATNYSLTCASGSYAVTGQAATFALAKKLTAATGSYNVTGQPATLTYTAGASGIAYNLSCEAGSYSVAGQAAQLIFTPAIMEIISRGGFKAKTEYKDNRKEVEADIARAIEKVTGVPKVLAKTVEIEPVNIPSKVQELVMQAQITALQIEIAQLTEAELDDEEILMLLL